MFAADILFFWQNFILKIRCRYYLSCNDGIYFFRLLFLALDLANCTRLNLLCVWVCVCACVCPANLLSRYPFQPESAFLYLHTSLHLLTFPLLHCMCWRWHEMTTFVLYSFLPSWLMPRIKGLCCLQSRLCIARLPYAAARCAAGCCCFEANGEEREAARDARQAVKRKVM